MSRRALIIAIEIYPLVEDNSIEPELKGTLCRARRFRSWLTDKWDREGIPKDEQHIIFCSEPKLEGERGASIDDIKLALDELQTRGRDMTEECYVYFSGHGFTFDKKATRSSMLIAADYRSMKFSGDRCANLDWIVLWLTMNMGPGRHYFFIDACRNVLDASVIQPRDTLLSNESASAGEPDSFLLQSSRPKETAPADGTFADALLDGLAGRGTAKIWDRSDPDAMVVRFDTLRDFIKQRINRKIHQSVTGDGGDASGLILKLKPPPKSKCTIHLTGGEAAGSVVFAGERTHLREPLNGASSRYDVPPDNYKITLDLAGTSALPKEAVIKLYDDAETTFSLGPSFAQPDQTEATSAITVPPDTSLTLQSREGQPVRTLTEGTHRYIPRGKYGAVLSDSQNRIIRADELILAGNDPVDIGEWTRGAIRKFILDRFPKDPNGGIVLSPSLERALIDTDLDILLSLLGAAKILEGDPRVPANEIERFPLNDFASEKPGSSPVFVLGAFEDDETKLEVSVRRTGAPSWALASESELASLRDFRATPEAGPLLVSLRRGGDAIAYTLTSFAFPNRVTLITVTQDGDGGFTIGQYFVPLGHLTSEFDYPTSSRHGDPLLDVLASSRMTRSFRRRRSVLSDLQFYAGRDLVEGNWLDPMAMLLATYEALRRRRRDSDLATMVSALHEHFSDLADAKILASLLRGERPRLETDLPIFMDGFVAAGGSASDLPPGSSQDYSSIWTAWHELPPRT